MKFFFLSRGKSPLKPKTGLSGAPICGFVLFYFLFFLCAGAGAQQAGKYRISGTVVNANTGDILRNATVTLGRSQSQDVLASTTTADDGGFRFEGLAAGKYWMRGEASGFAAQGFDEHAGFFTGIVTGGSVDAEHLMFSLRPDAAIVGEILDEANEPVREAQVKLYRRETQDGKEVTSLRVAAQSNDEGRYRFGHLASGRYFVAVEARPWYAQSESTVMNGAPDLRLDGDMNQMVSDGGMNSTEEEAKTELDRALDVTYPLTFYPGATDENGATAIVLQAGDRATADVRLSPVAAAHLHVPRMTADPSEGMNVTLMRRVFDGPEEPVQAQSEQSEKGYVIGGIAPGDYEVQAQSFGKNPQSWTQPVAVRGDMELSLEHATAMANVKGVVKMEGSGAPVSRGFVSLINRATNERMGARVTEKGEFEFSSQPVAPGSYEVAAGTTPTGRVSRVTASGAKVAGETLEIGGAATVELTIYLEQKFATIDGTVMREGKPAAGAMVMLVPEDLRNQESMVRRDQSDLDGTFSLRGVVPGKYTVVAIQKGWDLDWMSPAVMAEYLKGGETVRAVGGQNYEVKVKAQ
jgi:hypothetical protein